MKSRVNREVQARFCERFRGEIPLFLLNYAQGVINQSLNKLIFLLFHSIYLNT